MAQARAGRRELRPARRTHVVRARRALVLREHEWAMSVIICAPLPAPAFSFLPALMSAPGPGPASGVRVGKGRRSARAHAQVEHVRVRVFEEGARGRGGRRLFVVYREAGEWAVVIERAQGRVGWGIRR